MAKTKTPKTAIVSSTPVSLTGIHAAGITEFKLTKEDLIDLLVAEATATVEEEISQAHLKIKATLEEIKQDKVLAEEEISAFYEAHPAVKVLKKQYPAYVAKLVNSYNAYSFSLCLSPSVDHPNRGESIYLQLPNPSELYNRATGSRSALCGQYHEELKTLQVLEEKLDSVKRSTKALRTQMVRKILSNNPAGNSVLANVKDLSTTFLDSLKK